ncbi:flagellar associated protein [Ectocarpus siliculosus]|uniref:Flagellar associated protein n=1 Tax=Ectocarpus siliculosus TaxID=2880 RepID=D8LL72_ECTSI|nr:flagellar associated protein [Ectocarpus siliculosus]|eukprot:CBN76132.1 flagellar associated protein [Ectocarpus siliculosus]
MDALEQIFLDFTSFGAGQSGSSEMDSAKFVKLAKDCKLVGKNLSTTDLDLIFTKVKDKTAKKINFDTFVEAVELISEKLGKSKDDVILLIVSAKGPTTGAATVADNVRFHDDKSTFTGVHNNGGPTNIDGHNVDMANQLDRSEGADVRGVKEYQNDSRSSGSSAVPRRSSQGETARRASGGKTTAQRKSSTQGKGAATATASSAAAPRKSSSSAAAPRKSSSSAAPRGSASIGPIGPAAIGADGSVQDVEQRVADVFVAFASSVAKVTVDIAYESGRDRL